MSEPMVPPAEPIANPLVSQAEQRPALALRSLEIRRFLGIRERNQQLSLPCDAGQMFSPGVNVVFGPNASGKTTSALALQTLLWPEAPHAQHCSISGTFDLDNRSWAVEVEAGRAQFSQQGRIAPRPPRLMVGSMERRDYYRLALHELLRADDLALAGQIQNEINGGLDLSRAATDLNLNMNVPGTNHNECRSLRIASDAARTLRLRQSELQQRQATLRQLSAAVEATRDASAQAHVLKKLLALREFERDWERAAATAAAFPAAIRGLAGSEYDDSQRLRDELHTKQLALRAVAQDLQGAKLRRQQTTLDRPPSLAELTRLDSLLQQVKEQDAELARLDTAIASAAAAVALARTRMGLPCTDAQLRALEREGLEELGAFVREAEDVRGQTSALRTVLDYMQPDPEPTVALGEARPIMRGIDLLCQWLRGAQALPLPGQVRVVAALAILTMTALVGALAAVHSLGWLAALPLPLLLAVALIYWKPPTANGAAVASAYIETGLPAPAAWTVAAVQSCLADLTDQLAAVQLAADKASFVRARQADQEALEQRINRLEAQRTRLVAQLGVPADCLDARLHLISENLLLWQQADHDLVKWRTQAAMVRQASANSLSQFKRCLAPFTDPGQGEANDRHQASGMLKDVQNRAAIYTAATQQINSVQTNAELLEAEIAQLDQRRRLILTKVQSEPAAESAAPTLAQLEERLRQLIEQLPAYREAVNASAAAHRDFQRAENELREDEHFRLPLLELSCSEVVTALAAAERQAAGYEEALGQLKQLQTEIAHAKQAHDLEAALCAKANAQLALDELRCTVERAAAGRLVLDLIRRRNQSNASQVLSMARELFGAITQHSFELRVDSAAGARFVAYDTRAKRERVLNELSSGTRVQLLLAVRLAFIEHQEGDGPRLPVLLDELLGNSDDVRAAAVIAAVAEIARRGRQVFYFTAQRDELDKWQEKLAATAEAKLCIHELRLSGEPATPLELAMPPPPSRDSIVAPPQGIAYAEYGLQLGVPALDPYLTQVSHLHMWHLLTDPQQLYGFVQAGYWCWGQVEQLLEVKGSAVLRQLNICSDPRAFEQARVCAAVLLEAARLWQVGRGKPVTKQVLCALESPLTAAFAEKVADCAAACNGDAPRLLAALEQKAVKNLRADSRNKLQLYLEELGYLSSQPVLPNELIQLRIHGFAADWIEAGLISQPRVQELVSRVITAGTTAAI